MLFPTPARGEETTLYGFRRGLDVSVMLAKRIQKFDTGLVAFPGGLKKYAVSPLADFSLLRRPDA